LLEAEGYSVVTLFDERCCGALSSHAGRLKEARASARAMSDRLELVRYDALLTTAAGCGSAIGEYGSLLAEDPKYRERAQRVSDSAVDVMVFLAQRSSPVKLGVLSRRAVYHFACHLVHGQKVGVEAVERLRSIPGLDLIELPINDLCCGSAGTFNLLQPEMARELGQRKAKSIRSFEPEIVVAGNPGCILQLQKHLGEGYQVLHPLELLRQSQLAALKEAE
jgi:glycolate oxidase iron-sulfur subunit